jgi:hypothetical protein
MHPSCLFREQLKQCASRHKFLPAEDELLRTLVERYGETNWNLISKFMRRRNARQCRERYRNYLSPIFRNVPWTADEERLLIEKVKEHGQKWSVIARSFEARSDVNVKNHWAAMSSRNERMQRYEQAKRVEVSGALDEFRVDEEADWAVGVLGRIGCDQEELDFFN